MKEEKDGVIQRSTSAINNKEMAKSEVQMKEPNSIIVSVDKLILFILNIPIFIEVQLK